MNLTRRLFAFAAALLIGLTPGVSTLAQESTSQFFPPVGTTANTVAAGNDSRIVGAAQKANNLSDLTSAATARANLGIPSSPAGISGSPAAGALAKWTSGTNLGAADLTGDVTTSGGTDTSVVAIGGVAPGPFATGTNAANLTGVAPASVLPDPTTSSLGGVEALAAVTHKFITSISPSGVPSAAQPSCADLSNAAASCATDATNAANIGSGILPAARLPNPSASTLGGIQSAAAVTHEWIASISTSGVPSLSQPAFADISGQASAAQLPNPSASTLGGIESAAAVSHEWIASISTSGVPALSRPSCEDLSDSGTACDASTGTSGATLGFLNGSLTFSGTNTHTGAETFDQPLVDQIYAALPEFSTQYYGGSSGSPAPASATGGPSAAPWASNGTFGGYDFWAASFVPPKVIQLTAASTPTVQFTGSISNGSGSAGTVLNVTAIASGSLAVGDIIENNYCCYSVKAPTVITAQTSGTAGGVGNYTVSTSQLVASNTVNYAVVPTAWTVPSDWSSTNSLECISGTAESTAGVPGISSGAYSKAANVSGLSPGATIYYDAGHAGGTTGDPHGGNCVFFTAAGVPIVGAQGSAAQGNTTSGGNPAGGALAAYGTGSTTTSGALGGTEGLSGAGGAGASGPSGIGGAGGNGNNNATSAGAGGGANGGGAGANGSGTTPGSPGGAGANGGGSGGAATTTAGNPGAAGGCTWTTNPGGVCFGPGGGGAGGAWVSGGNGGAGGLYGGAPGSPGVASGQSNVAGEPGVAVVTYYSANSVTMAGPQAGIYGRALQTWTPTARGVSLDVYTTAPNATAMARTWTFGGNGGLWWNGATPATGADEGTGSINATAIYINGAGVAPLASPAFTGAPTAPTQTSADNSTDIATDAFVKNQAYAPLASPALTGSPTAPTKSTADNSTDLATDAFVQSNLSSYLTSASAASTYAPIASPTLTGTPAAPTPGSNVNTTQIPTTAWVNTWFAPLASPALTGTPTVSTATASTGACFNGSKGLISCAPASINTGTTGASLAGPASNTSFTMLGVSANLSAAFTPTKGGNFTFTIVFDATTSTTTAAVGFKFFAVYGTGSAPGNGASAVGTQCGTTHTFTSPTTVAGSGGDEHQPISVTCTATGLTNGTTYWTDLAVEAANAPSDSLNTLANVAVMGNEF